jgi:hypothetical protein
MKPHMIADVEHILDTTGNGNMAGERANGITDWSVQIAWSATCIATRTPGDTPDQAGTRGWTARNEATIGLV